MRPPIPTLPKPGPSKPIEVMEDFSVAKPPTQTPVTTFYTSIEPYLRPIREEDIGFLEHTGDEVEPYVLPRLGRHYLDVWAEQDAALLGATLPPGAGTLRDAPPDTFAPPAPKWDPSTLGENDLTTEARGHGPLTERVLSALLPMTDATVWKGVKAAEDAMEGRPGGSAAAAARKEKMNVTDLEARIRDTMRYHGLLDLPVSLAFICLSLMADGVARSPTTQRKSTTQSRPRCATPNASYAPSSQRTRRGRHA
jgi:transcriptional adapter 3